MKKEGINMKKKLTIAISLLIMALGFTTIAQAHWADDYVGHAVSSQWITPDQAADPDAVMSYEEFITMMVKADKIYNPDEELTEELIINDISDTNMFSNGVFNSAVKHGIIYQENYDRGMMQPYREMNRGDMSVLLCRMMGYSYEANNIDMSNTEQAFADQYDMEDWLQRFMYVCSKYGLIEGDENGYANFHNGVTVGEASALLCRAIDEMTQGIVDGATVYQRNYEEPLELKYPVQIIGDFVYLSTEDIFANLHDPSAPGDTAEPPKYNPEIIHNPEQCILTYADSVLREFSTWGSRTYYHVKLIYTAGFNSVYGEKIYDYNSPRPGKYQYLINSDDIPKENITPRMLYGTVMIPVLCINKSAYPQLDICVPRPGLSYDESDKKLTITNGLDNFLYDFR